MLFGLADSIIHFNDPDVNLLNH